MSGYCIDGFRNKREIFSSVVFLDVGEESVDNASNRDHLDVALNTPGESL